MNAWLITATSSSIRLLGCAATPSDTVGLDGKRVQSGLWAGLRIDKNPWIGNDQQVVAAIREQMDGPVLAPSLFLPQKREGVGTCGTMGRQPRRGRDHDKHEHDYSNVGGQVDWFYTKQDVTDGASAENGSR